jgi:hypothetical protein
VDSVCDGVSGLVQMGVQAADLVDGERYQLVGIVTVRDVMM